MSKYQKWARENYKPLEEINEMWHPEVQAECGVMNKEELDRLSAAEEKKRQDRERIKDVVSGVADISAELAGRIVVKVSFDGSLPKKKALTAEEKKLVMTKAEGVNAKLGGEKPLFECEEYDALMGFISKRRDEFAAFGIPHMKFQAANVVDINYIPEIEELAAKTEAELPGRVAEVVRVWPDVLKKAQADLGPLFNPRDYKPAEAFMGMFRFDYTWMAFGVPEELKQFDVRIYEKAQEKAKATWAEIEANGVALLRGVIADLVANLADSLTPKDGGEKKKFFPSSVTKITEFIENFQKRNICKDAELEARVEQLRGMVEGLDVGKLSAGAGGDEALRERVRKQMEAVKPALSSLVTSARARLIRFED